MNPYYECKYGTVYCGDCVDVMKSMADNSVDLTITSPPYGNLRQYDGYFFDFESVAQELYRITAEGGVVVWVVNDTTVDGSESGTSFRQALQFKEIGFKLYDTMIYDSDKIPLNHRRYEQRFEYMFVLSKGVPKTFNAIMVESNSAGAKCCGTFRKKDGHMEKAHNTDVRADTHIRGNIWHYNTGYMQSASDKIAFEHPAIFPEALARDHIISWSNPGDTVFDPFGGSGTTAKMAYMSGRKFITCDISEKYCDLIRRRIEQATQQCRIEEVFFDADNGNN